MRKHHNVLVQQVPVYLYDHFQVIKDIKVRSNMQKLRPVKKYAWPVDFFIYQSNWLVIKKFVLEVMSEFDPPRLFWRLIFVFCDGDADNQYSRHFSKQNNFPKLLYTLTFIYIFLAFSLVAMKAKKRLLKRFISNQRTIIT